MASKKMFDDTRVPKRDDGNDEDDGALQRHDEAGPSPE